MKRTRTHQKPTDSHASRPFFSTGSHTSEATPFFSSPSSLRSGARSAPIVQAKLTIGQPNDQYEQEADRVADQVMRMPEPNIQRMCPECKCKEEMQRQPIQEDEKKQSTLQTKPLAESITPMVKRLPGSAEEEKKKQGEETLQPKTTSSEPPTASNTLQKQISALQGGGQPLPAAERAFFEPRFGHDFSQVKIHTDSQADATVRAVNARAFTVKQDVAFGAGQYQPRSPAGQRLLAHELVHTIQQSGFLQVPQRFPPQPNQIFRQQDNDPLKSIEATLLQQVPQVVWQFKLKFTHTERVFNGTIRLPQGLTEGKYQLSSPIKYPAQGQNWVIFDFESPPSTGLDPFPWVYIFCGNKEDYDELERGRAYLESEQVNVPLILKNASGIHHYEMPLDYLNPPGASPEGESGKIKRNQPEEYVWDPQKYPAAEDWLTKELLPVVKKILTEKFPNQVTYELIPYISTSIQEKEGSDVLMIQIGKYPNIIDHVRVYRSKWVDQDKDSQAQYAEHVAIEIIDKVQNQRRYQQSRPQARQRWQKPGMPSKRRGQAYEFPQLPSKISGLTLQPIGGSGTYTMVLDYAASAPDLLSQASWAAQPVGYRWELWDISEAPEVKEAEKRIKAGRGKDVGSMRQPSRMEGAGRGLGRTTEDLLKRPAQIRKDQEEAIAEGRYADALANELNQKLLGLEVVTSYGKELLGAAADFLGDNRERTIAWTKRGVYIIRCIAAINPNAGPDEPARAPSIATLVVTTRSLESISQEAIDDLAAQAAQAQAELEILKLFGNVDPAILKEVEERYKLLQLEATGSPAEIILKRLAIVSDKLNAARSRSILIKMGFHDPDVWELEQQKKHLDKQFNLALERLKELGRQAVRVHGSLVSRITGQIYPLLLQVREPAFDNGSKEWQCLLSDITTPDGGKYLGKSKESPLKSVWEAVERFAGTAEYGEGSLTVRLPNEGWFGVFSETERIQTFESRARDWTAAKARLEALGTALAVAGLVVSSPITGVAGGLLAAGLAAERIIKRLENDTFRWDIQAVGDILDILGAVALGAKAIGALEYVGDIAKIPANQSKLIPPNFDFGFALKPIRVIGAIGEVTENVSDIGGLIICNVTTAGALADIAKEEKKGTITATEARRRRAERIASAIQTHGLIIASHLASKQLFDREPEQPSTGKKHGEAVTPPSHPTVVEPDSPPIPTEKAKAIRQKVADDLPEATVIMDPNPTRFMDSSSIYYGCASQSPHREVTMYRNTETGAYIIVQGTEATTFVEKHGPSGGAEGPAGGGYAQRWKEILDKDQDVGHWDLVAHYHPVDKGRQGVRFPDRFPSGLSGDFGVLMAESARSGNQPRTSRIDFWNGEAWTQTLFGYDPSSSTAKVWIDYPDQFGQRQHLSFPELEGYHQWYRDTFGISLDKRKSNPPGSSHPPSHPTPAAPTPSQSSLMDPKGHLTPEGIAFIRKNFRTLQEGKQKTPLDEVDDARLNQAFSHQPGWVEAVVVQERKHQWQQRGQTPTEFLMANPQQTLSQVFQQLAKAATSEGRGRRTNSSLLSEDVYTFVKQLCVDGSDPLLKPAWDKVVQYSKDPHFPDTRRDCLNFLNFSKENDFLLGKIGNKKPDIVEVTLGQNRIIVTDATLAYNHPLHNFKTAFYIAVIQRLIGGIKVEGQDFRAIKRQTLIK
ncbi:MAG: hypothetical protein B0A82_26620 [Alkalinema sp. CACIAM 70d]|nr:MAG: hypothetical protein B0A82_26620 [Alkalinema sp. CACIAM 70d]